MRSLLVGMLLPSSAALMGGQRVREVKHRVTPLRLLNNFFNSLIDESRIDYSSLKGRPRSLGFEAGEWALNGEVPIKSTDGWEVATFAGGCFWGTELHFQRFPGVIATCVGYTQGRDDRPMYQEVSTGRSGHTESVMVLYNPAETSYEMLCEKLLSTVDPTLRDQVGNDYGTQYRHGLYPHTKQQMEVAKACVAKVQARLPPGKKCHTEVADAKIFWPAEEYHQQYLQKGGRFGSPQSAAKGASDPVRCYG
eukprot:Transcript_8657.p1 GENE.Transcript_8657~~Transcript_8657.p1  ORF type:complete len:284 (+),score=88.69 Transcript_8657:101-853(+)